jgi:integrase
MLERNVLIGTKRPQPEQRRDRVLSESELRAVWLASDPATDFGAIVRLLILLGQRREEVGGMLWSELDLDRALWRLPGSRTKNHRLHDVPLPTQAVAILAACRRLEARDAVFGRSRHGDGFGGWSNCKRELDAAVNLPVWKLHDLRRSAVTHMAEIGVDPSIIEAVVNHISGARAGVAGVYNHAKYATPKRAALQRWADHVDRIVAGEVAGNVVAFAR